MAKFTGYMRATARVTCNFIEVEADTLAGAVAKVRARGTGGYTFELEDRTDIEGDEFAYLDACDGAPIPDGPIDVPLHANGEPLSWEATELVKHLAAQPDLPDFDLLLMDRDRLKAELDGFRDFITRARMACGISEASKCGS